MSVSSMCCNQLQSQLHLLMSLRSIYSGNIIVHYKLDHWPMTWTSLVHCLYISTFVKFKTLILLKGCTEKVLIYDATKFNTLYSVNDSL